jgi:hypothetical protein
VAGAELDGIFFILDGDPAGGFGDSAQKLAADSGVFSVI